MTVSLKVDWREVLTSRRLIPLIGIYIIPTLLLYHLDLNLAFTPRGFVYSNEIAPLFLAPWAIPLSLPTILSRLIQLVILAQLPLSSSTLIYPFWLVLGITRGITGFVLTRSVGWAIPPLFRHWALYEASAGVGPGLVAVLSLQTDLPSYLLPALATGFCYLERRPWTYGTALSLVLAIRAFRSPLVQKATEYLPLPKDETLPNGSAPPPTSPSWKPLLLCFLPLVTFSFIPSPRLPWPTNASMDILMLTYPRPINPTLDAELVSKTIDSYIPHLSNQILMAVFTHADRHANQAFGMLAGKYRQVMFYADDDTHPEDHKGQALHLAEAFRWWSESRPTEWVMLVEDDFPICPGRWDVIETVVNMLERDRRRGEVRSGFIGTGGSGLIIHRSYLPLLIHLLRLYSASHPIFPPDTHLRAPDQVVQDCLLGRPATLCERTLPQGANLPFSWFGGDESGRRGNVIISSRLVMDHIGGMATTQQGKALNEDKWRCGWRHAFEGDEQVEVVVV